jgi:hypothetical protein
MHHLDYLKQKNPIFSYQAYFAPPNIVLSNHFNEEFKRFASLYDVLNY